MTYSRPTFPYLAGGTAAGGNRSWLSPNTTRVLSSLAIILMAAGSLAAKDKEVSLRWQDLPPSLIGQKVKVIQLDNKKISGRLLQIAPDSLQLEFRTAGRNVARTNIARIETPRKFTRTRARILGTAIGAGVGVAITAAALTYRHNENGSNSDAIVGASVGVAIGTTLFGYWVGREADSDLTVFRIVPN